jgi:hypothetical protein
MGSFAFAESGDSKFDLLTTVERIAVLRQDDFSTLTHRSRKKYETQQE